MRVRDVMTTNLVTASPNTSVTEVARMMADHDVGAVIITENDQPKGIVTDRDIVVQHIAKGHMKDCPISEAMTSNRPIMGLVTVQPDMDILEAARELGRRKVGRLPVLENGHLVGILSAGDISQELRRALDGLMAEGEKAASGTTDPNATQQGTYAPQEETVYGSKEQTTYAPTETSTTMRSDRTP